MILLLAEDLTVTGTFDFTNAKSGNIQASSVAIGTSEPSQPFQVGSGTTEVFVVDSFGSVGIASTQPMANLDVNGAARFKSYSERVKQLDIVANAVDPLICLMQIVLPVLQYRTSTSLS